VFAEVSAGGDFDLDSDLDLLLNVGVGLFECVLEVLIFEDDLPLRGGL
jgi:hypothetical protein